MCACRVTAVLAVGLALAGCPLPVGDPDAPGYAYQLDDLYFPRDAALAPDGGLLIVGDTWGEHTMGVAKLNPDKTVAWSRALLGMSMPHPHCSQLAAMDDEGGALLVGSHKWLNSVYGEPQRTMLHRINADGETLWQRPYGPGNHHPTACIRSGNGFVVAVRGFSYLTGEQGDLDPHGFFAFVAKIADDGEELWRTELQVGDFELYPRAMAERGDGSIVLVARHGISREASPYVGPGNVAVFLLSASGGAVWSKTLDVDHPEDYEPSSVVIGPNGSIWIAGTRSSIWGFPANTSSIFALRLDSEGEPVWRADDLHGDANWLDRSESRDLVVHSDGRAAVLGTRYTSFAVDLPWLPMPYPVATRQTPCVLQIDARGRRLWYREFAAEESAEAIVITAHETYAIVGSSACDGFTPPLVKLYGIGPEGNIEQNAPR